MLTIRCAIYCSIYVCVFCIFYILHYVLKSIGAGGCRFTVFMLHVVPIIVWRSVLGYIHICTNEKREEKKKNCKLHKMHRFYSGCERNIQLQLHRFASHFGHRKVCSLGSEAIRFVFALEKIQLSSMWVGTEISNFPSRPPSCTTHTICVCVCVCVHSHLIRFSFCLSKEIHQFCKNFVELFFPFLVHHVLLLYFFACLLHQLSVCHFSLEIIYRIRIYSSPDERSMNKNLPILINCRLRSNCNPRERQQQHQQ